MNIERAKRDRWLLGVCGGIAHRYGWSSNLVRLVTVLLGILLPGPNVLILVIYVVLGLILPESEEF